MALRIITTGKSPYNAHTKSLFLELNLLNITQIRTAQTLEFMYKFNNNLLPTAFTDYFPTVKHTHFTRTDREYISVYPRTNIRKFSIKYQGPLIWNNLPATFRTVKPFSHFKQLIKAHIAKNEVCL